MSEVSTAKGIVPHGEPEMKGWLFKWTNYLKGYQRRWFVLQNGLLSYYRNQAEMAHTCRGNISLHGALIHTVDSCTFVISNGGTQTFHIKAASEIERQSWVTALELAKARAIRSMESEEDEEEASVDGGVSTEELNSLIRELRARLEDMQTCSELIAKHGAALQRLLGELEQQPVSDSDGGACESDARSKAVGERATLFRIASNAMINACSEFLGVAQTQGHKWMRVIQFERDHRGRLEDTIEQLARQHSHLEMAATAHITHTSSSGLPPASDDDEENEFYDCMGNAEETTDENAFVMNIPVADERRDSSDSSDDEKEPTSKTKKVLFVKSGVHIAPVSDISEDPSRKVTFSIRERRKRVPDKPNYPLNLWSIMKNCIGKDLSKIPMPVNFSEPLSMLQRLTEDYEYADILNIAARCIDPCEQLAYVAAFTVSSYSTTSNRTGKPFNPLLGETYECDRMDDLGWRSISEQVSHHPPMVAQYCEGAHWRCWQEFTMTSKFRGKYIQVIPMGTAHVEFLPSGNRYSWRKVTTTVHNIIVGKLWVDHHGDMEIVGRAGEAQGLTAHLKYIPYSYFTRDTQRRVKGCVMDASKSVRWIVTGTWDTKIEIAAVTTPAKQNAAGNAVFETGPSLTAWKKRAPPPDCDRYYGFTVLAAQLNEAEDGVAPTDSRLRPDQRLMENGRWEEANHEKVRLEEKQRTTRRLREAEAENSARQGRPYPPYEPVWFTKCKEEDTGVISHMYKGTYWQCKEKQEWSKCPDIF